MKLHILFSMVSMVLGSTITVREGDNFSLPCVMEETLWRHENVVILYITGGQIQPFQNVTLEVAQNGTHLLIQNAKPGYSGVSLTIIASSSNVQQVTELFNKREAINDIEK